MPRLEENPRLSIARRSKLNSMRPTAPSTAGFHSKVLLMWAWPTTAEAPGASGGRLNVYVRDAGVLSPSVGFPPNCVWANPMAPGDWLMTEKSQVGTSEEMPKSLSKKVLMTGLAESVEASRKSVKMVRNGSYPSGRE